MDWYIWVPWVLLGLGAIVIIIWVFWEREQKAVLRLQLSQAEKDAENKITQITQETQEKLSSQDAATKEALQKMERVFKDKLNQLSRWEKEKYHEIKETPQLGIDYILDFIGDED